MAGDYTTTAILRANVGQYVAAFTSAKGVYKSFLSTVNSTRTSPIDALGNSSTIVSRTMKSAMAVGATALLGVGGAAIKTGADFEHQMSRVAAISGATGKDFTGLKKEAIDLGAKTQFSAKQAAEGMENLASAGLKPKEIMAAMPGVLNLAAVSGGNVAEAADDAATAMNGFGLEASKSGHVADVFARAAADTNAEAQDMGQALKMVAPQAHAAGLSLEETSAAIGILSNAGIKGTEAGSNLAMALTKVQNPSEEAKQAMQQIGFSAYDSSGKMKPLAQQVEELRGKLAGMTDQQKQYYMSEIYGVQGGRAMNVLLDSQPGKLEKLTNSLVHSDGAAEKMATRMQKDLASAIEQFGGALESLGITIEGVFDHDLRKGVNAGTDAIDKLTKYIQSNQGEIQKEIQHIEKMAKAFLGILPSIDQVARTLKTLLPILATIEAFKGIGVGAAKTLKFMDTMQADLTLVSRGVTVTSSSFKKFIGLANSLSLKPFINAVNGGTKAVFNFGYELGSEKATQLFKNKLSDLANSFTGIIPKSKQASKAMIEALLNPRSAVEQLKGAMTGATEAINTKMFSFLKTMGATDQQLAILTNTAVKDGEAMSGIGKGIKGSTAGMVAGTVAAGGLGSSLGALIPIAAGVAAVAGAIYYAWNKNIGNIQGVVKTAISGITTMFNSLQRPINAISQSLDPVKSILKNIIGAIGMIAISSITASVIGLAGALRITMDVLAAVAQAIIATGYAVTGVFEKVATLGKKGDAELKKAQTSFNGAKNSIGDIGTALVDTKNIAIDSFSQMGKSADKSKSSAKGVTVAIGQVSGAAKQMKKDFDNSKTKLSDLIDTQGVSDKTKEFLNNVSKTLTQYQATVNKASQDYQKQISAAGKKSGAERLKLLNEANAKLADATTKNNQQLLRVTQDLDRQLQQKKFTDGTAMNADQFQLLTEQNNQYKQKLIEQNQIYIQAQQARIKNGQKLNKTQQQATISTIQSNYQLESQQIQVGEQKIAELKQKIANAKDQTTKAQLQQELDRTEQHNKQLLNKQKTFGEQMNLTIANGHKLNYKTWSNGLSQLNNLTGQQLQSMFLSFVSMNKDTSQQMKAFAFTLQRSGIQGVNGLVQALSDGKFTAKEAAQVMNSNTIQGLQSLPNSMFVKGDAGKTSFINALKNGDFKGAGKYLADESSKGANAKAGHGKAGDAHSKHYQKAIKVNNKMTHSTGNDLAKSGAKGAMKAKGEYTKAGKTNGSAYNSGIRSKINESHSAGKSLAQSAKSGASGVSFYSVGSNMALGVANGIYGNTHSAVAAMRNLVNRVNAEAKRVAKIHSPSQLMQDEIGKYLATGVAAGIDQNASVASTAMRNLLNNLTSSVQEQSLNFDVNVSQFGNSGLDHTVNFITNSNKQPLNLTLNINGHAFNALVSDITHQQDINISLGRFL